MTIIDQLVYKISGDNSQFDSSLANSDKKMDAFGKVAKGIFGVVTVAAIGMTIKKLFDMSTVLIASASDAEETKNKFNVTFSSIRADADATAKNLAANYGLSQQKSEDLLSSTGDLLSGFGFTQESALDLSTQVNTLAVDLASFTNYSGGAEGASAALTKALLGERESIKSLGIAITEADIAQLAEDKGITGTLDRQTKAQLTLEIAVKQSKNAIGDFARSSDGYANQVRILDASMDDLKTTLGNKLLPAATSIIGVMNGVVTALDSNKTASGQLSPQLSTLIRLNNDYKIALDKSKEGIEGVTDATLEQIAIEKQAILVKLESTYFESQKELSKLNKTIEESQAVNIRNNTVLDEMAKKYNTTRAGLVELYNQEQMSTENRDKYKDTVDAINLSYKHYTEAMGEANTAQINQKQFLDALIQGYADGSIDIERFIDLDKNLYDQIIKGAKEREEAIEKQIQAGLGATAQVEEEGEVTEKVINDVNEAYKTFYADLAKLRGTDKDKAFALIQEQANEYIASGIRLTDVAKWQSEMIVAYRQQEIEASKEVSEAIDTNEIPKAQELFDIYKTGYEKMRAEQAKVAEDAEEEAERVRDAWITASLGMLNSTSSIWGSINEIQANAHTDELTRMEENGASEEALDAKKKEFAIEEAKRSKAQSSFQAVIDTAGAIIGFLANPGGWAGVGLSAFAAGAGIAQIAAINSTPLPSYEVGTIDVPTDRVAQLHAGETVLTKGITDEAKTQGITIAPTNATNSGTPIMNVIYLDGKKISEAVMTYLNAGQVGRIDSRVVK